MKELGSKNLELMGSTEAEAVLLCRAREQWFSKWGSQIISMAVIWALSRNANFQVLPRYTESETLGMPIWIVALLNKDFHILAFTYWYEPSSYLPTDSKVKPADGFSNSINRSFNQHEASLQHYRKKAKKN